jgi:hypothetical protein
MRTKSTAWIAIGLLSGGGCAIPTLPTNRVLSDDSFVAKPANGPLAGPIDHSQDSQLIDRPRSGSGAAGTNDEASPQPISKTVRDSVKAPLVAAAAPGAPATSPTTQPWGNSSTGVDQVLGSVLADVDGNPIYADKVLAVLDRALAAEAKKYNADQFRDVAADLVQRQVMEFIHADVEFAAAKRNLADKDQQIATQETIRWRQQQIAQAGGSVEQARLKARADGADFEDLANQHYRLTMTQIYYQRRVIPEIQISASDIRDYYDQNRDKEFAQPALVRFRVIRIDTDKTGSREAALDKITHLRDRINAGADFAAVAGEVNDDEALLRHHGDPQPGDWMTQGAFVSDKVDHAVWALQPGQTTDIIEDTVGGEDAFFLARLESRKGGVTQPFDDQDVQDKIRETLRRQQFNALREKMRDELEKKAVIRTNPDMMQVTLDMVMQKYPQWAGTTAAQ